MFYPKREVVSGVMVKPSYSCEICAVGRKTVPATKWYTVVIDPLGRLWYACSECFRVMEELGWVTESGGLESVAGGGLRDDFVG